MIDALDIHTSGVSPEPVRRGPTPESGLYGRFLTALGQSGFEGEFSSRRSDRLVLATDNSIYQTEPDAVAFPRSTADLVRIGKALARPEFAEVVVRPRGGGTGTNGQSLGNGLVVDVSRHMTGILDIDVARRRARVQPGVIKDQLNETLRPFGLFFAPELSTSSRATIGGMVSTDACGQGSCPYGKTSNHVLELETILVGGEKLRTSALKEADQTRLPARARAIWQGLTAIQRENATLITKRFPRLNRSLTGYDLAHLVRGNGGIDPVSVLCGSEGTLALLSEITLNLEPIPAAVSLIVLPYKDFLSALRDAALLTELGASSVETIDSLILSLAREDVSWRGVARYFPEKGAEGINIIEVRPIRRMCWNRRSSGSSAASRMPAGRWTIASCRRRMSRRSGPCARRW